MRDLRINQPITASNSISTADAQQNKRSNIKNQLPQRASESNQVYYKIDQPINQSNQNQRSIKSSSIAEVVQQSTTNMKHLKNLHICLEQAGGVEWPPNIDAIQWGLFLI